jgi:hypothetical protein
MSVASPTAHDLYYYLPLNPKDQPNAQTLTDHGGGRGGDWIGFSQKKHITIDFITPIYYFIMDGSCLPNQPFIKRVAFYGHRIIT